MLQVLHMGGYQDLTDKLVLAASVVKEKQYHGFSMILRGSNLDLRKPNDNGFILNDDKNPLGSRPLNSLEP